MWYWLPDFLFPALGYFTIVCWIAPKNPVVNQIFGMKSGIGLFPLTLDWSQIAYISSPLVAPPWAIFNVLASLVFWIYLVSPALYYSNTWFSGFLPIQSNSVFDNTASIYNVSKVIDRRDGFTFSEQKYAAYSPLYMPITYALNMFGLSFATIPALLIWIYLEKAKEIGVAIRGFLKTEHHRGNHGSSNPVPSWWYIASGMLSLGLAMFACEYYPVQLRWYGALFAFFVSCVFFVPLATVYATTNLKINIDIFCRIIAGYVFEGKVLANTWFFDLGYVSGVKGLQFAQDLKLGHYCHVGNASTEICKPQLTCAQIPARTLFFVQLIGLVVSTISQVGVVNWAIHHIPDICSTDAPNGFTCPFSRTHFNTSIIWGAIGPRRFFSIQSTYHPLLYFFLLGGSLPVVVWLLKRRNPAGIWRHVHVPLFLGGLNYIPPASGTNYGSWAAVGLLSGVIIKQRARKWWRRYNFVLSSALDCSVAIAGVVIFFAVFYTGASKDFSWWGTNVYKNTCDWKACPYRSLGSGETFGTGK
ncbi:Oligopeptide transporter OPT superfamily [Macrophomina phaseolina MS6]|uniref:Oligopeptide transporter OPT superfamily n=1 Tax=Macrophomina phaseolina (strain MS6) TaxID=1126212 RepID=K2RU28_MACPH|nr:Oligopeptide transporter OPT superfamily [Macrophomina phaseolina MS6]